MSSFVTARNPNSSKQSLPKLGQRELSHSLSRNSKATLQQKSSRKGLSQNRSKSKHNQSNNENAEDVNIMLDYQTIELMSPGVKTNGTAGDKSSQNKKRSLLPSIMSNRKDPLEIYKQNYLLNMDTLLLNARQNQVQLNNYYRKLIRQRVPISSNQTPLKVAEFG